MHVLDLADFLDISDFAIYVLSDRFSIVFCNTVAKNFLNKSKKKYIGKDFLKICEQNQIVFSIDLKKVLKEIIEHKEIVSRQYNSNSRLPVIYQWKVSILNKEESRYFLLLGMNAVMDCFSLDFLLTRSSFFNQLINNLPHAIFWKNEKSQFLVCNQKFADSVSLSSSDEVIGKTDDDLPWSPAESEIYRLNDKEVMETGQEKINIEESQITKDGRNIYLLTSKMPLHHERRIFGVLGIYTDITSIKEMEKQLIDMTNSASRAKSEFIANMSHDLRTPITGILGLAQSWLQTAEKFEHRQDAVLLIETLQELLKLLNEIMEVVTLDQDCVSNKKEYFSVQAVILHNVSLLKSAVKHKKLKLKYSVDSSVPEYIWGNRVYLDRILLNLLSNAVKFTMRGEVFLKVSLVKRMEQYLYCSFSVSDTGVGIPPDQKDEIFKHFYRLTSSYQGVYKGSGLGLYMVKKYVIAMEGKIHVTSELGKGSCFTVEFPFLSSLPNKKLTSQNKNLAYLDKHSATISDNNSHFARVLVVEDNCLAARMVLQLLSQVGCVADWVDRGEKAVDAFKKTAYDLVLLDIGLPDIDGLKVSERIRALQSTSEVPIVALTGHMPLEKKDSLVGYGIKDLIIKPISLLEVNNLLKKYALRAQ